MSTNKKASFALTALEKKWILYDVGNSAFILLVSTIFPIYFNYLAETAGLTPEAYLIYWGYAVSFVTVVVAFLGPILGSLSDKPNMKKKLLRIFALCGAISCIVLGLTHSWVAFLVVFILGKIFYSLSLIFYDAMLIDVTTEERMDKVSSYGYAWGYAGSCIPFVLSLVFVLFYEQIGIGFTTAMLIAFTINGCWWWFLTIPLLKSYEQRHSHKEGHANAIKSLLHTLKDITKNKEVFLFLLAFFFYIDGVYTIIDMATVYGTALGLDSTGLLLALLVTQLVAFPFAILFGRLSQKYSTDILVSICILAYVGIAIFAIFLRTQPQFWVLAIWVGMFQGGIQALSRSHFSKIIPSDKAGEYFGIMDICGKGASFLGTMLVSVCTQISGNSSVGVSVITPCILIGFILFRLSLKYSKRK